ncbi:hypothetical protein BC938DRAFT_472945 [Jimgerdemannia flammicorona]|uniref:F-box domain-containing protein n=1 Tax=Jimgerdemannia flammicorona TaxID=994334 RepID=A0A433QTL7_9FUNG|nr:hypothetical protein BC938DRAFT_472945 [Jimgerdemannia flammicorona]
MLSTSPAQPSSQHLPGNPYLPPQKLASVLPLELLENIIGFLLDYPSSVRTTVIPPPNQHLRAFATVCRAWHHASLPHRFQHVHLTHTDTGYDDRVRHFAAMDRFYCANPHLGQLVRIVTLDMTVLRDGPMVTRSAEGTVTSRARDLIATVPVRRLTLSMSGQGHKRRYSSGETLEDIRPLALHLHSIMQTMPGVTIWRLDFDRQKYRLSKTARILFETMTFHGVGAKKATTLHLSSLPKLYTVPPATPIYNWIGSLARLETLETVAFTSRFFTLDLRHAMRATQAPITTIKLLGLRFWDSDDRWLPFPHVSSHLVSVDITNTVGLMYGSRFLHQLAENCPAVRHLSLAIPDVSNSDKEMNIHGTWDRNFFAFQEGIFNVVDRCSDLRTLDLSYHRALPDNVLTRVLAGAARLEKLKLRGCEEVTGRKVGEIRCVGLRELDVKECNNVAAMFLSKVVRICAECVVVGDDLAY